jgi:glyoxylase-like metal-dependent hydrolase (beta-lactamase superfamily II)
VTHAVVRAAVRLFAGFWLACAAVVAIAQPVTPTSPTAVSPRQVSASAWYVQGDSALGSAANRNFVSNAGFVVTPAGVVVIDALGSPALARELMAQIKHLTGKSVTHVILTHYHADHIYGLQEFKAAGAKIIAHQAAREYLNSDTAQSRLIASRTDLAPWIDANTRLVPADEWIDGPRDLDIGGVKLLLRPVGPAHTPEDLVGFLPSEKVLFAGDIVFRGRIPYVGQADSRSWIAALNSVLAFDASVIVPGHGQVSTSARDLDPFEEAFAKADWSRFEHLPLFRAANRMNAYNTYLLMEREAK